jgi:MFS family permease
MAAPSTHAERRQQIANDVFLSRAETWALIGCQPLAQLSNQALLPSLGSMRVDLGLSYFELGAVIAAFGVARLLVDLPAGSLADRWNPRGVLVAAFAASAIGSALGVLATNVWQIAGVRLLIGVGSSIAQAMILAWIVGGSGRAARGRVLARSEAFFAVLGLATPALSGVLAASFGWRVAFVMGAVAAVIGVCAVLGFTRASSAARAVGFDDQRVDRLPAPPWQDLRIGGHVLLGAYLATFAVFFCRHGILQAVLPVLGADKLALEPPQIGLLFSAVSAVSIASVLLGGRLADQFGRYRMLTCGLIVLLATQLLLFFVQDKTTYVLVVLLQGVAYFVNPLPPILLGDSLPPRLRPRGIAVYRAVSDVALLSAPALMGMALQFGGFTAAESVSAVIVFALVVAVWVVGRAFRAKIILDAPI